MADQQPELTARHCFEGAEKMPEAPETPPSPLLAEYQRLKDAPGTHIYDHGMVKERGQAPGEYVNRHSVVYSSADQSESIEVKLAPDQVSKKEVPTMIRQVMSPDNRLQTDWYSVDTHLRSATEWTTDRPEGQTLKTATMNPSTGLVTDLRGMFDSNNEHRHPSFVYYYEFLRDGAATSCKYTEDLGAEYEGPPTTVWQIQK